MMDLDHSAAKAGEAEKSTPKEDFTQTGRKFVYLPAKLNY
jgi:hypothetical protein